VEKFLGEYLFSFMLHAISTLVGSIPIDLSFVNIAGIYAEIDDLFRENEGSKGFSRGCNLSELNCVALISSWKVSILRRAPSFAYQLRSGRQDDTIEHQF